MVYDSINIARLPPDLKLLVGRSAALENCVEVANLFARPKIVHDIVDELQKVTLSD